MHTQSLLYLGVKIISILHVELLDQQILSLIIDWSRIET